MTSGPADSTVALLADDSIRLPDGRRLGYTEVGIPDGHPLVLFHGFPGSRYFHHPNDNMTVDHDIRAISLDRPGFGRSTYDPDRRLIDWATDVSAAADALGIEQFTVAGVSGGGPYALACAIELPDRVTGAAIVNGLAPLDAPNVTDGMMQRNRLMFKLAALPFALRLWFWPMARGFRTKPVATVDKIATELPKPDQRLLEQPAVRKWLITDIQEAARQGTRSWAYEGRLLARPWGFDISEVSVHVDLWHGGLARNAPVSMGQYLAEHLPDCTARIYPDEGHFLFIDHWAEILKIANRG